ncbi:hypothetical protein QBC35DRAFT_500975 [Podospora australis]|uniref:Secreted protein n=1 Tax=Podospora australis TaxID=1536484 RepID=A0AAN7AI49_9PEZI|nr:hypothetical protein QBC35DRAFT_500975 [Podospora australis]
MRHVVFLLFFLFHLFFSPCLGDSELDCFLRPSLFCFTTRETQAHADGLDMTIRQGLFAFADLFTHFLLISFRDNFHRNSL